MGTKGISLEGIYPPVPTPLGDDGHVAVEPLKQNLRSLARHSLNGFVVLGSNGELVLMSKEERLQILDAARGSIPSDRLMIAGTGCQSTAATAFLTREAAKRGANAALVLPPFYYRNAMTEEALRIHFHSVADASPIPLIIYNMPACTGLDLTAKMVATLAKHENIIGIKDSGGEIVKMAEMCKLTSPDFQVLAGSASFLLPALSVGAVGGVLALANIAPSHCLAILEHFRCGELESARDLQLKIIPANSAVTRGWGVPALKAAMDLLGLYGGLPRPPLLPLSEDRKQELARILRDAGIEGPN